MPSILCMVAKCCTGVIRGCWIWMIVGGLAGRAGVGQGPATGARGARPETGANASSHTHALCKRR
jgi:hypothetical protein